MNPRPTTPTESRGHGGVPRGLEQTPASATETGRFGRIFRRLPVFEQQRKSLLELGTAMIQELEEGKQDKPLGEPDDDENTATLDDELRLPAGYTYFGQFVDHDITFDPVSSLERQNDPDSLTDFRTPRFDLDSLYGHGPADQPYLYEPDGVHLALGMPVSDNLAVLGPDLQRGPGQRAVMGEPGSPPTIADAEERAIIGDPRNDENLIVSQLQVAFLLFHNRVVDQVHEDHPGLGPTDLFKLAQQRVRWHYQWVVIHDYLRRLVGPETVDDILRPEQYITPAGQAQVLRDRRLFYDWRRSPFMPVEFSVAAYRFGHSIARPSYVINDVIPLPVVDDASRIPLFSPNGSPTQHLNGFRKLPDEWGIQWKFLLPHTNDAAGPNDQHLPQPSYKLDAQLSHPLGLLPNAVAGPEEIVAGEPPEKAQNLAVRNLLRGLGMGLPAGQDVARAMGIEPLTDSQLFDDVEGLSDAARSDLASGAPLWFYVLKEAQVGADAAHLGAVGGRIVAEVLIGLLAGDPLSYLSVNPTWTPTLSGRTEGQFTLSDIVNFAKPAPEGPPPAPVYQP
jgi:Animal haem peroxidase